MKHVFSQEQLEEFKARAGTATLVAVACFGLVAIRLLILQVWQGHHYRNYSTQNSVREFRIDAERGVILDRTGKVLASSRNRFDLGFVPQYVPDRNRLVETLPKWFDIPADKVAGLVKASRNAPLFQPVMFSADADWSQAAWLLAHRAMLVSDPASPYRGVELFARPMRTYPYGETLAHVLGYVGEVEENEKKFQPGELVGRTGLERAWDAQLRGEAGFEAKLVDAIGREVQATRDDSTPTHQTPVPGWTLQTTLDVQLQQEAAHFLAGKVGGVVMMDIETGDILVMASSPPFDPSKMVGQERGNYFKSILSDERRPFYNRATQGTYAPGSTFKIVTALAGLTNGTIKEDDKVVCPGYLRFGNRIFRCWRDGGHGVVDLKRAITESCDVYFYTMGLRMGIDRIADMAQKLGLESRSGVEIEEQKGLIPSQAWKEATMKQPWFEGETLSVAIGQGYDLVTPIAMARMLAGVISGKLPTPHLTDWFRDADGNYWGKAGGWSVRALDVDPVMRSKVVAALGDVVQNPSGTAHGSFSAKIPFGGKTGTAQSTRGDNHAWFVGFAPLDHPKVVVSIVVEHGGHGASAAAPLAKHLFEKWLETGQEANARP